MKLLRAAVAFSACLVFAQEHPPAEMCFRHVTVINVATVAELKDQTVRIQGARIASIAPTQDADNTPSSVDAHGAFLIPGLWDMHVHVHDKDELPLYVANGVTGVRVMSGEKDTAALRKELATETPSPGSLPRQRDCRWQVLRSGRNRSSATSSLRLAASSMTSKPAALTS